MFSDETTLMEIAKNELTAITNLVELFRKLSVVCKLNDKKIVLMIDEVDSASNNQVFLDFLAQLRGYYLIRNKRPTFQSVIRPCEKISVNSTTVIKNDIASGLKNSRSIFLQYTINTVICQVSSTVSLSGYMISSSPRTLPQFLSGIVHFFVISWVARYKAFKSAVSLGNTLLCLFRRR